MSQQKCYMKNSTSKEVEMQNNLVKFDKNSSDIYDDKMIRAKDMSKIFIGTSQATYDNWVKAGLIYRYKIGGGVYYKLSEVKALIETSRENQKEYRKVS